MRATASVVFEAAMTGQLVVTTLHARSAADAIRRLLDMQIPPHQLLCGLNLLACQRLLKATCQCQTKASQMTATQATATQATAINSQEKAKSCPACNGTGYTGRFVLSELFPRIEKELARAIMSDADSRQFETLARAAGMINLEQQATEAVSRSSELQPLNFGDTLHHEPPAVATFRTLGDLSTDRSACPRTLADLRRDRVEFTRDTTAQNGSASR